MRTEEFYTRKLQDYWDRHYSKYNATAEWYTNPAINIWKCEIPALRARITLVCNDNGVVTEKSKHI